MEQMYLEQLIRIYNTLMTIATKGEDTIIMGQCLGAMKEVLVEAQKNPISVDDKDE